MLNATPLPAPLRLYTGRVDADWIDVNNHMNARYYGLVIYDAHVLLTEYLGLGGDYVAASNCSKVVAESHCVYERELMLGDPIEVVSWLLAVDAKRLHFVHELYHAEHGYRAALGEQVDVHVDLALRRSAPFPPALFARLSAIAAAHSALPPPAKIGRRVGFARG
jgi:acyl-CoA thioester hydrolase